MVGLDMAIVQIGIGDGLSMLCPSPNACSDSSCRSFPLPIDSAKDHSPLRLDLVDAERVVVA